MGLDDDQFKDFTQDGITIARDRRANSRILDIASRRLAEQRAGTEYDLHLSDILSCVRKGQLQVERNKGLKAMGSEPEVEKLDGTRVVYFSLGYSFQNFLIGSEAEKPQLHTEVVDGEEVRFWVSPDGADLWPGAPLNEIKTTTRSPRKVADRKEGRFVEEVLHTSNPYWFEYMMAAMHVMNVQEYNLSVAWLVGGPTNVGLETFKVSATEEKIEQNWEKRVMPGVRLYAQAQATGTLAPFNHPFQIMRYCGNCKMRGSEPCLTEVREYMLSHPDEASF